MHLSSRLIFSLLAGVAAVSMIFSMYQAAWEVHALRDEVQRQALTLAESQQRTVERILESGSAPEVRAFVDQFQSKDRFAGIGIYDATGAVMAITSTTTSYLAGTPQAVMRSLHTRHVEGQFFQHSGIPMHVLALPIGPGNALLGVVAVFHKVTHNGSAVWRQVLTSVAQTLLIVAITLLVIRWSMGKYLLNVTRWLRALHAGQAASDTAAPREEILRPLATEVTRLATSLQEARAAAREEARLRETAQALWTAEQLRVSVQSKLKGSRLFAVSNREPYEHVHQDGSITWRIPPSGLVTALEPVLRACDGTWIAQGTGPADRETADGCGRLRVPPDHPQYTLRRVWLTQEEEEGFYFGFANEGLWPLCHIAHTRPIFRAADWESYRTVNSRFAAALLDEMEHEEDPLVLVQDYHFALLPQLIKQHRPDARVAIFWHIPWPNSEAFGICPWQSELLEGMLGADLIGFHIQAHCNNFLETVDRALESRIDREHFAVHRREHLTAVRPFPISVEFNGQNGTERLAPQPNDRLAVLHQLGFQASLLGLGVDRIDYTKGILERFRGIERFLVQHPSYQGKLAFVQIGAPSRTHIKRYQDLITEVEQEAERINQRFGGGAWQPIVLLTRHHTHDEIQRYYRAADFCLITALHDGMNLVAKEYVAARSDEDGVLILSRFAGASHELAGALVVNPYDTGELSESIHTALAMPPEERRGRMQRMRAVVKENNVYRWAGTLIGELASIRLEPVEPPASQSAEHPLLSV